MITYVRRITEEILPKDAFDWMPPERKKRGRPSQFRGENKRKVMSERNSTKGQCHDRI